VTVDLLHDANYLVAWDQGQTGMGQLPVNDMQICPAHGAAVYAQ
jgi:hypothetical protein